MIQSSDITNKKKIFHSDFVYIFFSQFINCYWFCTVNLISKHSYLEYSNGVMSSEIKGIVLNLYDQSHQNSLLHYSGSVESNHFTSNLQCHHECLSLQIVMPSSRIQDKLQHHKRRIVLMHHTVTSRKFILYASIIYRSSTRHSCDI